MLIGGGLGYRLLKWIHPKNRVSKSMVEEYASPREKINVMYGESVFDRILGKTVIDFGSGEGGVTIELARSGAQKVIGLEIQERSRDLSMQRAREAGVAEICEFAATTKEKADIVLSLDAFEHFDDPADILAKMANVVKDDGEIWISFSWSWYHPYGGHLFSVFPWSHLLFTENSLIRWRSEIKDDGATCFREVAGGLNQITIKRFQQFVEDSPFEFSEFMLTPIRPLRWLHNRLTREFTTSLIHARLKPKVVSQRPSCAKSGEYASA